VSQLTGFSRFGELVRRLALDTRAGTVYRFPRAKNLVAATALVTDETIGVVSHRRQRHQHHQYHRDRTEAHDRRKHCRHCVQEATKIRNENCYSLFS